MRYILKIAILILLCGCEADLSVMGNLLKNNPDKVEIFAMSTQEAQPGDLVKVAGMNLKDGLLVEINSKRVVLDVISPTVARFRVPMDTGPISSVNFLDGRKTNLASFRLSSTQSGATLPVLDTTPDTICSDIAYQNPEGQLKSGQRNCTASVETCSDDNSYPCVTGEKYPALKRLQADAVRKQLHADVVLLGKAGELKDCEFDGDTGCYINAPVFRAALVTNIAPKIVFGQSVGGVSGLAVAGKSSCNADGQNDCISSPSFPSMQALQAGNFIKSGTVLGGKNGNVTVPAVQQVLSGFAYGSNSTLTGTFVIPSPSHVLSGSPSYGNPSSPTVPAYTPDFPPPAKVRANTTVDGQPGLIQDCSGNNGTGCYAMAAYPSYIKANVNEGTIKAGSAYLGVNGDFPSSTYPLAGAGSTADLTNLAAQLTTAASFEYFDSAGIHYTESGDVDIQATNLRAGIALENLGITGVMPLSLPSSPSLTATVGSPTTQNDISWSNTGATGYLLVSRSMQPVAFVPTNGQTYTAGAQGSDTILYVGTGNSFTHAALSANVSHNYAVYAFNSDHIYSAVTRTMESSRLCQGLNGGTWVPAPGDPDYYAKDFCVYKYEAKDTGSGFPVSQDALLPQGNMSMVTAQTSCRSLGTGYDLISNDQWMSLAINIASQGINWSSGVAGNGVIVRGHVDRYPSVPCAASPNDSLAYVQSDCTPGALGVDILTHRRTYYLSNGSVIWDLAGNLWEWTSEPISVDNHKPYSSAIGSPNGVYFDFPYLDSDFTVVPRSKLFPSISQRSFWRPTWTWIDGFGNYGPGTNGDGGTAYLRGGRCSSNTAGLFHVTFANPTLPGANNTYRCVYTPP